MNFGKNCLGFHVQKCVPQEMLNFREIPHWTIVYGRCLSKDFEEAALTRSGPGT